MTFIECMNRDGYALVGSDRDLKKNDQITGVLHNTGSNVLEPLPQPVYIIEKVSEETFRRYSLENGCPPGRIATRKFYYKVGSD